MRSEHVVAALQADEESDAATAAGEESVITNHVIGFRLVLVQERTRVNSLRYIPPAGEWAVINSDDNLLAHTRLNVEDFDHSFAAERDSARSFWAPHVHQIPVVLPKRGCGEV